MVQFHCAVVLLNYITLVRLSLMTNKGYLLTYLLTYLLSISYDPERNNEIRGFYLRVTTINTVSSCRCVQFLFTNFIWIPHNPEKIAHSSTVSDDV